VRRKAFRGGVLVQIGTLVIAKALKMNVASVRRAFHRMGETHVVIPWRMTVAESGDWQPTDSAAPVQRPKGEKGPSNRVATWYFVPHFAEVVSSIRKDAEIPKDNAQKPHAWLWYWRLMKLNEFDEWKIGDLPEHYDALQPPAQAVEIPTAIEAPRPPLELRRR
jgi:hypothetical protein